MSDTAQHLETEIEAHRAGVEQTLGKLKERLSVDQVIDDVGQFIGIDNVRQTLHVASQQFRENPMALALIGAGVAWLMMGRGSPAPTAQDNWRGSEDNWRGESDTGYGGRSGDGWEPYAGGQDKPVGADTTLTDKAKSTASDLAASLGEIPHELRNTMGKASESVQSTFDAVRDKAGSTARPLANTLSAQPLLVGAVTVVIGAILGSAMPRTRAEDRLLGPQRDKAMTAATRATSEVGHRMADAAKTTYQAAASAAQEEGLLPNGDGPTLAEKVERVATAVVDTAAGQVGPVLHGTDGESSDESHEATDTGDSEDSSGKSKGKRSLV